MNVFLKLDGNVHKIISASEIAYFISYVAIISPDENVIPFSSSATVIRSPNNADFDV